MKFYAMIAAFLCAWAADTVSRPEADDLDGAISALQETLSPDAPGLPVIDLQALARAADQVDRLTQDACRADELRDTQTLFSTIGRLTAAKRAVDDLTNGLLATRSQFVTLDEPERRPAIRSYLR